MKNFENFTNLYEISKTLRFELKPIGNTTALLEENKIIQNDKYRRKKYELVKPYFDKIHREFIEFSLKNTHLDIFNDFDISAYRDIYKKWYNNRKDAELTKEKEKFENNLMKQIGELFEKSVWDFLTHIDAGDAYDEKNINLDFLYRKEIFAILKQRYGDEKETLLTDSATGEVFSIFDGWGGWLGYFDKFFQTRKNLYKTDGTSTAIATRIARDNLRIFTENSIIFEKIADKIDISPLQKNFEKNILEVFSPSYFYQIFTQDGIDTYNTILGGETLENGQKLQWINEFINQYRQSSGEKIPYLKKLQKQILSEKETIFFNQIQNDTELIDILKIFFEKSTKRVDYLEKVFAKLGDFSDENYAKIYLNKMGFNTIIHRFADAGIFSRIVYEELKEAKFPGIKYDKNEEKYSFPDFIPLLYIKKALENYSSDTLFWKERCYLSSDWKDGFLLPENTDLWNQFCTILQFEFSSQFEKDSPSGEKFGYRVLQKNLQEKLWNFTLTTENKALLKGFADSALALYSFWKYFSLEKSRSWDGNIELDSDFYDGENGYIEQFYADAYEEIVKTYNLMRNYLTKKPWSDTNKWKINFESSSLLKGWDKDFASNGAYIFSRKNKYYLGISNGATPDEEILENLKKWQWEKIVRYIYDFQKPDNKNTPRLFIRSKGDSFAPAVEKYNLPIHEVIEIYDKGLFKTENKDSLYYKESLRKLIDYFKLGFSRHESYKHYNFVWKESSEYQNIADFYRDVEKSCYRLDTELLDFEALKKLTESKHLYLFQIYNKDFELDESLQFDGYHFQGKWQKNLHTKYFEALFSDDNRLRSDGTIFKLSGGGEVFSRPKAIDAKSEKRNFSREIIKNKRYSEEKLFLHFPIQMNFKAENAGNFNKKINAVLANNPDINILGIDRGEKHLSYFSVINQKWEILESGSFNYISSLDAQGNPITVAEKKIEEILDEQENIVDIELQDTGKSVNHVDYSTLLLYKEEKRKFQRQSWKEVEQIKDIKKWYISILVRKIADLAIQYNAIIVLEDLNMRFKQIRWGIERSIYQQLEKALIEKLSFLVNKNEMDPTKAGHLLRAYQLANIESADNLKAIGKQTGIIFYTEAAYTSKIDPLTGWRPHLYLKKVNGEKNKEVIRQFTDMVFNSAKNRFDITYDIRKFFGKDTQFPKKTIWTVSSSVERYKWDKKLNNNQWAYNHYTDMTKYFMELFQEYSIDFSHNILWQIENLQIERNQKFFEKFLDGFSLICQIRNTNPHKTGDENDFILSPVEPFFDSRKSQNFWKNLPKNGDENGAYNIARKGIVLLQRVNENSEKPDLYIKKNDWDDFTKN